MTKSADALAVAIRAARARQGVTQVKLVELGSGSFSLATLKNIESGSANPRLDIVTAILDALGVTLWLEAPGTHRWRITGD